jgi:hypothetical protein
MICKDVPHGGEMGAVKVLVEIMQVHDILKRTHRATWGIIRVPRNFDNFVPW